MTTIAVTGATGGMGGLVARRLAAAGARQRLVVRDPSRAPRLDGADVVTIAGYEDTDGMRRALEGAATLFFVPASEASDRVSLHRGVVDAAVAAGVERIVYLSFLHAAPDATFTFARDHWHTEAAVRAAGVRWTFVRDAMYQDFLPRMVGDDGTIRGPAGDGRVSAVARADAADVVAAVLVGDGHDGRTYDATGPAALSLDEVASEIARAAGRPVRYVPETVEEAFASRAVYGAPDWEVAGWVSTYTAIAAGELASVSDAVEAVAGHPAAPLAATLAADPRLVAHLRGVAD